MWALHRTRLRASLLRIAAAAGALVLVSFAVPGGASGGQYRAGTAAQNVLYSQLDETFGIGYISEIFTGRFAAYRSLGADDFTIPDGQTWSISQVVVRGRYHVAGGEQAAVLVTFYDSSGDSPGARLAVRRFPHPSGPNYLLDFPGRLVTLTSGTYWLSVQVIGPSSPPESPFWTWTTRGTANGTPAVWRNPGNGFGENCRTWTPLTQCYQHPLGPDYRFALKGAAG